MKRLFPLIISLVIPLGMAAQSQTDKTVEAIAEYLNEHCLEGAVTDAVCGRNHTIYGSYVVNNGPLHATATLLDGIAPLINRLPHKHRMTDEQADELFKGRIAMRLHPEQGDTSAFFLMDYNRTMVSFRYGVNSPKSINIVTELASDVKPNFNYRDLPKDSVAAIANLLRQMEQRKEALVIDTVFCYSENENYDWWMGAKGDASRTPAHVVLLQGVQQQDFLAWTEALAPLSGNPDVTIYKSSKHKDGNILQICATASFCTGGAFCLYHAVYYQECICVVRVVVPTWKHCNTVPDTRELIDHLRGQAKHAQPMNDISPELNQELRTLMETMRGRSDAQVVDTLFVSNDHEGHEWWIGLNGPCPTKAQIVRTRCPREEYQALSARLLTLSNVESGSDEKLSPNRTVLRWMDGKGCYHAFYLYYFIHQQLLVLERADGLEPYSICIPHSSLSLPEMKK